MHKWIISLLLLSVTYLSFGQGRDLVPGKRGKNVFGKRDFNSYKNYGLQFSVGGSFLTALPGEGWQQSDSAAGRYQYNYSPKSGYGMFAEIGMAFFPEKGLIVPLAGKKVRLLSYWDWGLGIKNQRGSEELQLEYFDNMGNVIATDAARATFNHILPYARVSAHHNFYFKSGHFIDWGIGANFDYRMIDETYNYDEDFRFESQKFSANFFSQLHTSLGFGLKIRRGLYFIPSAGLPILQVSPWNNGSTQLNWFSSSYRPWEVRAKLIILFKDKAKGCNNGTEEDRKRNKEFMQNK